jgi:hypothetical protein
MALLTRSDGKHTHLGYFNNQEEAARTFDRMTLWRELHEQETQRKFGGFHITNYDRGDYADETEELRVCSLAELVKRLKQLGKMQELGEVNNGEAERSASGGEEIRGRR